MAGRLVICISCIIYNLCHCYDASNQCTAMRVLLRHGANPRVQDDTGSTPLHHACSRQSAALATAVELLLRYGTDETPQRKG